MEIPLKMIFEETLTDDIFPDDWKKGNIVLVHLFIERPTNMVIKYHPISLPPMLVTIFEIIIFTSMFEYFIEN